MRERVEFEGGAGRIVADTRHFPYVLMRSVGDLEVETIDRYAEWQRRLFAWIAREGVRCVWISDIQANVPSPALRRHVTSRRGELDAEYREWVVCELVVVYSSVVRGVFTLFRMVNPRFEVETFASLDKALDRARARLLDAGVEALNPGANAFVDPEPRE